MFLALMAHQTPSGIWSTRSSLFLSFKECDISRLHQPEIHRSCMQTLHLQGPQEEIFEVNATKEDKMHQYNDPRNDR